MDFFNGETSRYRKFDLVVTTHRLILDKKQQNQLQAVTLDCLGMCEYTMKTKPWLIAVGALAAAAGIGILVNDNNGGWAAIVIGAVCIAAYFLTKKAVVKIHADGSSIDIETARHREDELEEAINVMQRAHIEYVYKTSVPARVEDRAPTLTK